MKLGVARLSRGEVEHFGFGDERADPIGLRAGFNRARDPGNDLVQPLERHGAGGDGLPPRRLLVEPRHVHVAIAGEETACAGSASRSSPGARRRCLSLGLQREPLMHAEAVLLVDDDQAEIAEGDALLEQRVGADEDIDAAVLQRS